jgi:uronate dehydrogenase
VVVTGAEGRIGSAFRDAYQSKWRGAYRLRLAVRDTSFSDPRFDDVRRFELNELTSVEHAIEGARAILHLAANAHDDAVFGELLEPNLVGVQNVFEAARRAGVARVVFASSIHVVLGRPGDYQTHVAEPPRPDCLYGATKTFGEALCSVYSDDEHLSAIAVRIGAFVPDSELARWASDQPEYLSMAVTGRDLCELLHRCLVAPSDLRFGVVHGLSNNRYKWLEMESTRALVGFTPRDDAFLATSSAEASSRPEPEETRVETVDPMGRRRLVDADLSGRQFELQTYEWAVLVDQDHGNDGAGGNGTPQIKEARFVRCTFRNVHFPGALLESVSFRDCVFDTCDFRDCRFDQCDFRFSRFVQSTFQDAIVRRTDFRLAWFQGATAFVGSRTLLRAVSFDRTDLGGADIPWRAVAGGILHEDEDELKAFIVRNSPEWRQDPDYAYETTEAHVEEACAERFSVAAGAYRTLAGMYEARGRYGDAKRAYVKARQLEEHDARSWNKWGSRLARWTCLYGESAGRVLVSLLVVVLLGALLFYFALPSHPGDGWNAMMDRALAALGDGFANLVDRLPDSGDLAGWERFLAALQTAAGIALAGLLGFVLGNTLRRR